MTIQFISWVTKSYLTVVLVFMRCLFSVVYLCMDDITFPTSISFMRADS